MVSSFSLSAQPNPTYRSEYVHKVYSVAIVATLMPDHSSVYDIHFMQCEEQYGWPATPDTCTHLSNE